MKTAAFPSNFNRALLTLIVILVICMHYNITPYVDVVYIINYEYPKIECKLVYIYIFILWLKKYVY